MGQGHWPSIASADFPALTEYDASDVGRYLDADFCIECGVNLYYGHLQECASIPAEVWPDLCPECADGLHEDCVHASVWGLCGCGCRNARSFRLGRSVRGEVTRV